MPTLDACGVDSRVGLRYERLPQAETTAQHAGSAELDPRIRRSATDSRVTGTASGLIHAGGAAARTLPRQRGKTALRDQGRRFDGSPPRTAGRTTKDLDAVFRGAFEDWLEALDDALADDIEEFAFSREEPEAIRDTKSFRVNIIIDFKGRRWGKVQFEVAPVEVSSVLNVDQVDPFDIGQFGLPAPGQISVVGLPYPIAQKLHACTEVFEGEENARVHDLMDLLLARVAKESSP